MKTSTTTSSLKQTAYVFKVFYMQMYDGAPVLRQFFFKNTILYYKVDDFFYKRYSFA